VVRSGATAKPLRGADRRSWSRGSPHPSREVRLTGAAGVSPDRKAGEGARSGPGVGLAAPAKWHAILGARRVRGRDRTPRSRRSRTRIARSGARRRAARDRSEGGAGAVVSACSGIRTPRSVPRGDRAGPDRRRRAVARC
jgi:hypothetical protein